MTAAEFFATIDLSKLDESTSALIRNFQSSDDYKYRDLSDNIDEFKRVVDMVEEHFPEALGRPSNEQKAKEAADKLAEEKRIKEEAEKEEQDIKDAAELHRSLLSLKKLDD